MRVEQERLGSDPVQVLFLSSLALGFHETSTASSWCHRCVLGSVYREEGPTLSLKAARGPPFYVISVLMGME